MHETPHGAPGSPGLAPVAVLPGTRDELKEAVRAAQGELESERRQERMARFEAEAAKQQAEQAEKWKKFTAEANLNGAQEQSLKTNLDAEAAKRKALMDQVRSGEKSFFEIRGEMRDTRQQTDAAMSQVLTQDQLKKYTEVRQSERREGGRGQGGWGGPGGGGNGDRGGPGGAWPR
jgi:chromosome segregation ATPase